LPGHQPGHYRRVVGIAAVQVGDHRAVLERVTDPGAEHDHRATSGGTGQLVQVELLQDGLLVRPGDGPAQRRQRRGVIPVGPAGPGVQVIEDAAAAGGDGGRGRRQLD